MRVIDVDITDRGAARTRVDTGLQTGLSNYFAGAPASVFCLQTEPDQRCPSGSGVNVLELTDV
jgi:hypothetical protein